MEALDILAHHPSTAKFISTKLATRFVSDYPPTALIDRMAETFRKKNGDIREVLRTMFASPEFWAARVKPGRILFELDGVPGPLAAEAFSRAAMKLPIKTKVVARLGDTSHLEG